MNLAICDDINNDRSLTEMLVRQYIENNNIPAQIYTYDSGENFLNSADIQFDAVFMDIFMGTTNGLEAAKAYPNKNCRFIFTTTSPDLALKSFSVNVIHYLMKPITYEDISEAMRRCFPLPQKNDPVINIKQKRITIPIYQSDISYVEVFGNTLVVHTPKKDINARMPLKTFYEQLDHSVFIRPRRSYIVNMNYIDEIKTDSLLLSNGATIYISREQMSNTRIKYEKFLFEKIREENKMI